MGSGVYRVSDDDDDDDDDEETLIIITSHTTLNTNCLVFMSDFWHLNCQQSQMHMLMMMMIMQQ